MNTKTIAIITVSALFFPACEQGTLEETREFNKEINSVEASIESTNLEILPSEDGTTTVEADVDYYFRKPDFEARIEGSTLVVDLDCRHGCEGWITIHVPVEVDVLVDNGSGNVLLDGIEGDLDLEAGSGNIKGKNLSSFTALADVGSGNVNLEFVETPEYVDLEAGSGNVKATVPYGSYDVSVSVGSGNADVDDLIDDPDAPNHIRAEAGSGNVTIKGVR
ncbi:MAG: DUF4097 domain-containing protein [Deltaproteobacteria bacterium]|nr:DUF4097 domain-containing protein [Deltaproteobacteria bacterium]